MAPEALIGRTRRTNGDMEMFFNLGSGTYQTEWQHSYGRAVLNPSVGQFSNFVYGREAIAPGRHKLLFGITQNGVCPADCMDCPFGRTLMARIYEQEKNRKLTLAKPITPIELQDVLKQTHQKGVDQGILSPGETFSAGALLAGDPSYSAHVPELIATVAKFPDCISCRWSTIAADTQHNVLEAFREGAARAKQLNPNHTTNYQVSVHSTDHATRVTHTGVDRLLSLEAIAKAAADIRGITGRKMSLSFVLHKDSVIDPRELDRVFSPDDTIISLRPVYSLTTQPMDPNQLIELYSELRKTRDVVYMPPTQTGSIDGKPMELFNERSHQLLGL